MKQRITPDQLLELTEEQQNKLRDLWEPCDGDFIYNKKHNHPEFLEVAPMPGCGDYLKHRDKFLPLLSIGQMIEMLFYCNLTNKYYSTSLIIDVNKYRPTIYCGNKNYEAGDSECENDELCDAIWQAVKAVL